MGETPRGASGERVRLLTETYRSILGRYEEIERLSRRERRLLRARGPVSEVNEMLREKKRMLSEIRVEEERVTGAREWWKRSRRSLNPAVGRDLLSLLDAISRTIERTVALEAECRALLQGTVSWGGGTVPQPGSAAGATAALAYARGADAREGKS